MKMNRIKGSNLSRSDLLCFNIGREIDLQADNAASGREPYISEDEAGQHQESVQQTKAPGETCFNEADPPENEPADPGKNVDPIKELEKMYEKFIY